MKSVVLTSAILSLAVIVYSPEANASSLPDYVSNAVTEQNINMVESDKHISTVSNICSQDTTTDTNYQLISGHFLLYFFYFVICLVLLFQFWLDYNLPTRKKYY